MKKSMLLPSVLLAAFPALAWWTTDGESPYGKLAPETYPTPHIEFVAPHAAQPKIFFTAFGIGQREVEEFRERVACTPVLFPVQSPDRWSPFDGPKRGLPYAVSMSEDTYREEAEKRYRALATCDAIVIGKSKLASVPTNVLDRLFARVKGGAGLVWIAFEDKKIDLPGVALTELAATNLFPVEATVSLQGTRLYEGTLGKGRVLEVVYPYPKGGVFENPELGTRFWIEPLTPFESDDPLGYEMCHAFLGKCVGRVLRGEKKIGGENRWTADVRYVNAMGREVPAGSRSALVKVARREGDFAVEPLAPRSTLALTLPKDAFRPGEEIRGAVRLPDDAAGTLRLTVTDEDGVEIVRLEQKAVPGRRPFAFTPVLRNGRYGELRAALLAADGALVDEAWGEVFFNRLDEDRQDFSFSAWAGAVPASRVGALTHKRFHEAGLDCLMEIERDRFNLKTLQKLTRDIRRAGLNHGHYVSSINGAGLRGMSGVDPHGKDCGVYSRWENWVKAGKPLPKQDPSTGEWSRDVPMNIAEAAKDMGIFFYNLGDENMSATHYSPENCFCDRCQARFRDYLRRTFGTVARMNAGLGENFADFEAVKAIDVKEARKTGRRALWTTFRAFMDEQLVLAHRYYFERIRAVDKISPIGAEGYSFTDSTFVALDYRQMLGDFGFCVSYYTSRDAHAIESFLQPGGIKGGWVGTYETEMDENFERRRPWQFLFNNMNAAFWWTAGNTRSSAAFDNCTIFRPDFGFLGHFEATAKEVRTIKESGLGLIFHGAKAHPSGVYVHYSNASLNGSSFDNATPLTEWGQSHADLLTPVEEAGVGYVYLASCDLEKTGLPADARVFILPYSICLSDAECAVVRAFVLNGGLVIADRMPGVFTEHGLKRAASPLATLFADRPLAVRRTGRGGAILTGETFSRFDVKIADNRVGGLVAGMADILAAWGATPFARVTDENDSLRRADFYRSGDLTLGCLLGPSVPAAKSAAREKSNPLGPETMARTLEATGISNHRILETKTPQWAYDMSQGGKLFGHGTRFELDLVPALGRVLVFTDREVTAPSLTLSAARIARGGSVRLSWKNATGCALVTVKAPDGKPVFAYRTTRSSVSFAPSWGEPLGTYVAEVRSAVGGTVATGTFEVTEGDR